MGIGELIAATSTDDYSPTPERLFARYFMALVTAC